MKLLEYLKMAFHECLPLHYQSPTLHDGPILSCHGHAALVFSLLKTELGKQCCVSNSKTGGVSSFHPETVIGVDLSFEFRLFCDL